MEFLIIIIITSFKIGPQGTGPRVGSSRNAIVDIITKYAKRTIFSSYY